MAHNRCVLKERRIHPLVLSPVLRWRTVWGWRWGLLAVGALRDRSCARRERWGQLGFRAAARRGVRVSTFLCSLRPDPAAARGALRNPLRFQKQIPLNCLGRGSKPGSCLREGIGCSLPMLAAARSRCRPGRPTESVTLPKADSFQRVGTGFLAGFLSARGFVGIGDLDPLLGSAS